jgi:hypothetical protein
MPTGGSNTATPFFRIFEEMAFDAIWKAYLFSPSTRPLQGYMRRAQIANTMRYAALDASQFKGIWNTTSRPTG